MWVVTETKNIYSLNFPFSSVSVPHVNCKTILSIKFFSTQLTGVHKLAGEMYGLDVFPQVVLVLVLLSADATFHQR